MGASPKALLECTKNGRILAASVLLVERESRPFKSTAGSQSHMTEGVN